MGTKIPWVTWRTREVGGSLEEPKSDLSTRYPRGMVLGLQLTDRPRSLYDQLKDINAPPSGQSVYQCKMIGASFQFSSKAANDGRQLSRLRSWQAGRSKGILVFLLHLKLCHVHVHRLFSMNKCLNFFISFARAIKCKITRGK